MRARARLSGVAPVRHLNGEPVHTMATVATSWGAPADRRKVIYMPPSGKFASGKSR